MEANEVTFNDVLLAGYELRVPIYQRRYAWEEDQHERLWSQIVRQYSLDSTSTRPPHFMGALVFAPGPAGGIGDPHRLIVDGQQRLITLLILLAAIREHGTPLVRRTIRERVAFPGENLRLRLVPGEDDRAYLDECFDLQAEEWTRANHRISRAWDFYSTAISEGLPRKGGSGRDPVNSRRLLQTVVDRLKFIRIVTDQASNPQEIFETLNHDGLKLSQADLIRNYLFMGVGRQVDSIYRTEFRPAEVALGGERAMSHFLMSDVLVDPRSRRLPHTPLRRNLFRSMQLITQEASGDPSAMAREVRRIGQSGREFASMLSGEVHGSTKHARVVRGQLMALHAWSSIPVHPILLHLHRSHGSHRIDTAEYARSLDVLLGFLVRRMLCNVSQSPLRSLFTRISLSPGFDLRSRRPSGDLKAELARAGWPTNDEVLAASRTRELYGSARAAQLREVLHRLMVARQRLDSRGRFLLAPYDDKPTATVETSQWSIEHLLPQRHSKWSVSEVAAAPVLHVLGNLTLTPTNPEMSNSVWSVKRDWLRSQSAIAEFQHLAKSQAWSPGAVLRRSRTQAELACRIWSGPPL